MLVSFSVSNFLSFKDSIEFSARATRERQHGHRVFTHGKVKLVPVAAIFGANASGKSNFYRALLFLRKMVLHLPQAADELIPVDHFKLDDGASSTTPTRFVIEIFPAETVYRLTVAFTRSGISEETLEEVDGDERTLLYSRITLHHGTSWDVGGLQSKLTETLDRDFIAFKTRDTLRNQLFLSALRGKNFPIIDDITGWFSEQLALMLPEATLHRLGFNLPTRRGLLEFCNDALRTAGTGVHDIHAQPVRWEDFPVTPEMKEELKKSIGEKQSTFVVTPEGVRFSVTRLHGDLHVDRIYTRHLSPGGNPVLFELSHESEGTQRFIDLLPAFFEMVRPGRPKVFVIDELDRSLHTQLARHLVRSYLLAMGPTARSQLIFTTHDVTLLDQDLLRRDEVWFMEKSPWHASMMQPLSSFEGIRYDRDIRRSYLDGTFGGVPMFGGPVFRALPGQTRPSLEAREMPKEPASSEFGMFAQAYPSTRADELVYRLVLDLIAERGTLASQALLDAVILATHPDICRALSLKKPSRKTDALFDSIRPEIDLIQQHGLRWHECLQYLAKNLGAISVDLSTPERVVSKTPKFAAVQEVNPSQYLPIALFVLSVLDSIKETRPPRGPMTERSYATRSFEQLRTQFAAT